MAYLLSLKQPVLAPTQPGAPPLGPSGGAAGFDAKKGAALFANNCASCHGAEGKGMPGAFPPLAGDPMVNAANPRAHIGTVLHGLSGKVINGQKYEAEMPAFADQLSDQQMADIIDYERSSWGNRGNLITAADVVAARNSSRQRRHQPRRWRPRRRRSMPHRDQSCSPIAAPSVTVPRARACLAYFRQLRAIRSLMPLTLPNTSPRCCAASVARRSTAISTWRR